MKQLLVGILSFQLAFFMSPDGLLRLDLAPQPAEARGSGKMNGFHGAPKPGGSGARTRPSKPAGAARPRPAIQRPTSKPALQRPAASKPSLKLPNRPANKPIQRPSARPSRPGGGDISLPVNRPEGFKPPGNRPSVDRQLGHRPPNARPPGNRPPITARPPGNRPPLARPPIAIRPRPPGWHPPHYHPPGWRPPYVRPPYPRPPHNVWGNYHYNDGWGWFFTAAMVGGTMAFVSSLPDDDCNKVSDSGETLYECDGKLYRSTYYKDEQVYEIVSDPPGAVTEVAEPQSVIGLSLTTPMTRGEVVRDLQTRLTQYGYDTGGTDGVFGSGTETALQWFQYDYGLDSTGTVDAATAAALGYASPAQGTAVPDVSPVQNGPPATTQETPTDTSQQPDTPVPATPAPLPIPVAPSD